MIREKDPKIWIRIWIRKWIRKHEDKSKNHKTHMLKNVNHLNNKKTQLYFSIYTYTKHDIT